MTVRAVVLGAGGGLGQALVEALVVDGWPEVHALSRAAEPVAGAHAGVADVTVEATLAAAAAKIGAPVDLVFVATGVLAGRAARPERRLDDLTPDGFAESFAVNATGPALAAKHFVPLLPRDRRAVFAVLSARVGSLADNRLGGWYGYRASKAALNMVMRTLAVELGRTHPHAVCAALHPGTVDTSLSRPFQRGVPAGQLQTPTAAVRRLIDTAARLTRIDSGRFLDADGRTLPF